MTRVAALLKRQKDPLDPAPYLKRMLGYEITHEPGYAAVANQCQQHLTVELYTLDDNARRRFALAVDTPGPLPSTRVVGRAAP